MNVNARQLMLCPRCKQHHEPRSFHEELQASAALESVRLLSRRMREHNITAERLWQLGPLGAERLRQLGPLGEAIADVLECAGRMGA